MVVSVLIEPSSNTSPAAQMFPTVQDLQNRKVIAIETYCNIDFDKDPNNPGIDVLSVPVFNRAFLTLYTSASGDGTNISGKGGKKEPGLMYNMIPLSSIRRVQNNDFSLSPLASFSKEIFRIRPTFLSLNKCKIELPTSITMQAPQSAVFVFHYLDEGDDGTMWM
jgi:hypothetical protein